MTASKSHVGLGPRDTGLVRAMTAELPKPWVGAQPEHRLQLPMSRAFQSTRPLCVSSFSTMWPGYLQRFIEPIDWKRPSVSRLHRCLGCLRFNVKHRVVRDIAFRAYTSGKRAVLSPMKGRTVDRSSRARRTVGRRDCWPLGRHWLRGRGGCARQLG